MAEFLEASQALQLVEWALFWLKKPNPQTTDRITRQRAISALVDALNGSDSTDAAAKLATIGHPGVVRWLLEKVRHRASAEWSVQLLERIVTDFSSSLETESLRALADLADPLQTIADPPRNWAGKPLPSYWENYRSIDCSALRNITAAELQRREAAEIERDKAAEEQQYQLEPAAHRVA
jgi:hypothetical protein